MVTSIAFPTAMSRDAEDREAVERGEADQLIPPEE